MERLVSRKEWHAVLLLMAIAFSYLLGSRPVHGLPAPPCKICNCKEIWARHNVDNDQGRKVKTGPLQYADTQWAYQLINSDACPDPDNIQQTNNNSAIFNHLNAPAVCGPVDPQKDIYEVSPTDKGSRQKGVYKLKQCVK